MKNRNGKQSCISSRETEKTLGQLIKTPKTAHLIFEFAESLFFRDETAERMSLSDIKQVGEFLNETDHDLKLMKKQFQDLAEIEGGFESGAIPVGF